MIMIPVLLVIYILVGVFLYQSTEDKSLGKKIVRMSTPYLIVGVVCTFGVSVLSVIMAVKGYFAFALTMLIFALLPASLIVAFFQCRVFYDEECFTSRNFFGKKIKICYSEITDVELGIDLIIFSKEKKIKIANYNVGRMDFLAVLKPYVDNFLALKSKVFIPTPKVKKFKDALHRPGEFIFGIVVMIMLGLFFLLVMLLYSGFHWIGILFVFLSLVGAFFMWYPAKRAHSSKFWFCISKLVYQKGYLKLDDKDVTFDTKADDSDSEEKCKEEDVFYNKYYKEDDDF